MNLFTIIIYVVFLQTGEAFCEHNLTCGTQSLTVIFAAVV